MKKILSLILSMVLCVTLTSCNSNQAVNAAANSTPSPLPTLSAAPATPTGQPAEQDQPADPVDGMYPAYVATLENLLQRHILPDGTDAGEQFGDLSENQFAVYDVDRDGKDELVLLYSTTITAGMAGYIFAYDSASGTLQTQLQEFPLLTFYENGVVKAGWSHNQGLAGDSFWPYSLYQYNPDLDRYELVGMVDAWDKSYAETDYQNHPFPDDIDKSGTGIVYYIMEDGQYDTTNPADASAYNAWVNAYIGGASEMRIQYRNLTEANISQIKNG